MSDSLQQTSYSYCALLGSGTCRLSQARATASAFLKVGTKLLLIDCGLGAVARLIEHDLLNGVEELHIHISHRHEDHLMGLFPLLQSLKWSDDYRDLGVERIKIHCTEEVHRIIHSIFDILGEDPQAINFSNPRRNRTVTFCPGPDSADWRYEFAGIEIASVHLPEFYNHGVSFSLAEKQIGFSCDATTLSPELLSFVAQLDLVVFDFGHLIYRADEQLNWSLDLSTVETLLTSAPQTDFIAIHAYLRDVQNEVLNEVQRDEIIQAQLQKVVASAKQKGFEGTCRLGFDGMPLLP